MALVLDRAIRQRNIEESTIVSVFQYLRNIMAAAETPHADTRSIPPKTNTLHGNPTRNSDLAEQSPVPAPNVNDSSLPSSSAGSANVSDELSKQNVPSDEAGQDAIQTLKLPRKKKNKVISMPPTDSSAIALDDSNKGNKQQVSEDEAEKEKAPTLKVPRKKTISSNTDPRNDSTESPKSNATSDKPAPSTGQSLKIPRKALRTRREVTEDVPEIETSIPEPTPLSKAVHITLTKDQRSAVLANVLEDAWIFLTRLDDFRIFAQPVRLSTVPQPNSSVSETGYREHCSPIFFDYS
jgi:hypothetical protein